MSLEYYSFFILIFEYYFSFSLLKYHWYFYSKKNYFDIRCDVRRFTQKNNTADLKEVKFVSCTTNQGKERPARSKVIFEQQNLIHLL